jgi:hypothetical protein
MSINIAYDATSLGNNGHIYALRRIILMRIAWDGVVPNNDFIVAVILKNT